MKAKSCEHENEFSVYIKWR